MWALYAPNGELVSLPGTCIGCTTNNISEYSAVAELFSKVISLGIRALFVKIDSQLIILQFNRALFRQKT